MGPTLSNAQSRKGIKIPDARGSLFVVLRSYIPKQTTERQRPQSLCETLRLVRVAAGPWTLEDGWWSKEPVERDYWDVELSRGGLYRIFRDRRSGDWFADGIYD